MQPPGCFLPACYSFCWVLGSHLPAGIFCSSTICLLTACTTCLLLPACPHTGMHLLPFTTTSLPTTVGLLTTSCYHFTCTLAALCHSDGKKVHHLLLKRPFLPGGPGTLGDQIRPGVRTTSPIFLHTSGALSPLILGGPCLTPPHLQLLLYLTPTDHHSGRPPPGASTGSHLPPTFYHHLISWAPMHSTGYILHTSTDHLITCLPCCTYTHRPTTTPLWVFSCLQCQEGLWEAILPSGIHYRLPATAPPGIFIWTLPHHMPSYSCLLVGSAVLHTGLFLWVTPAILHQPACLPAILGSMHTALSTAHSFPFSHHWVHTAHTSRCIPGFLGVHLPACDSVSWMPALRGGILEYHLCLPPGPWVLFYLGGPGPGCLCHLLPPCTCLACTAIGTACLRLPAPLPACHHLLCLPTDPTGAWKGSATTSCLWGCHLLPALGFSHCLSAWDSLSACSSYLATCLHSACLCKYIYIFSALFLLPASVLASCLPLIDSGSGSGTLLSPYAGSQTVLNNACAPSGLRMVLLIAALGLQQQVAASCTLAKRIYLYIYTGFARFFLWFSCTLSPPALWALSPACLPACTTASPGWESCLHVLHSLPACCHLPAISGFALSAHSLGPAVSHLLGVLHSAACTAFMGLLPLTGGTACLPAPASPASGTSCISALHTPPAETLPLTWSLSGFCHTLAWVELHGYSLGFLTGLPASLPGQLPLCTWVPALQPPPGTCHLQVCLPLHWEILPALHLILSAITCLHLSLHVFCCTCTAPACSSTLCTHSHTLCLHTCSHSPASLSLMHRCSGIICLESHFSYMGLTASVHHSATTLSFSLCWREVSLLYLEPHLGLGSLTAPLFWDFTCMPRFSAHALWMGSTRFSRFLHLSPALCHLTTFFLFLHWVSLEFSACLPGFCTSLHCIFLLCLITTLLCLCHSLSAILSGSFLLLILFLCLFLSHSCSTTAPALLSLMDLSSWVCLWISLSFFSLFFFA